MGRVIPKGFTLIELLIVVGIIGILSAIAIPTYQSYMMETRRSDAYALLSQAAAEQERYFAYHSKYTPLTAELGVTTSKKGYYTLSILSPTISSYTLTATPVAGQPQERDEECYTFTVDQLDVKKAFKKSSTLNTEACW